MHLSPAQYAEFLTAGLIGIILHLFVVKLPSLQKKAKAANLPFSVGGYLREDWVAMTGNVLTVVAVIFFWDEIPFNDWPLAMTPKVFIATIGFTGSSIVLGVASAFNKKLMGLLDIKANQADKVEPPVNESNKKGLDLVRDPNQSDTHEPSK